jgi:hypothetical protein
MIKLKRGKLLRMPEDAGKTVTAHTGTVWITEQCSSRDVVLQPGETFTLTQPGLALLQALSDAAISVR